MILAPHAVALAPAYFAAKKIPSSNDSSRESNPIAASLANIPHADSLDLSDGFYQRTSLSIRSHTQAKLRDGDLVSVDSHTKLRFQYDFQAADGTKIQIRLRVNSNFSQEGDGTDAEQSLRIRARLKVSVVQEQVNAGAAPLLDASNFSAEARELFTKALDLFQQVTDAAASAFEGSDPLDGDSLIASLVDAFNEFSDSLLGSFTGSPPALAPASVTGSVDTVGNNPIQTTVPAAPVIEAAPPAVVDPVPLPEAITEPATESAPPAPPESQSEEPAPITAPDDQDRQQFGQIVMFKLRAQVIQSLESLAGIFNSRASNSPDANSASVGNFFAKFSYQQLSINLTDPSGTGLDAQA